MNDYLISLYIDDELDLDDKIDFVEIVHENKSFKEDALNLLRQEKTHPFGGRGPRAGVRTQGATRSLAAEAAPTVRRRRCRTGRRSDPCRRYFGRHRNVSCSRTGL